MNIILPATAALLRNSRRRASSHRLRPLSAAESADLVAELRQFTPEVLLQLLRHCRAQADEVLEALGWGSAAPLYRFMRERDALVAGGRPAWA